ncbi:MAG: hypothetical protein KDD66_13970 [Bdellovibrionales bacterium]|nr:hypothetical protein [Bdellovibrionales bacterium]
MSRLQMDVVPAFSWTVMRPMARKTLQWLKNASVLTASLLGVAFVTLSIGFTGLNPLDELHQQHKQTVEQKRVREASSAMIPLVKDKKVSKVSVSSRLAQEDSVQPLFGPAAVESCRSWCSVEPGMSVNLCQQGCSRLSLEEFGRRITVADPSPAADAVQVASRCQIERQSFGVDESRAAWRERVRSSLEVLEATRMDAQVSFSKAKVGHAQMVRISNFVQLPPGASEADRSLAQQMAEVACLRANLALSEMGRHIAAESMDEISHRYYSEFSSSLHPLVSKRESRLETNAKDIRWSRSLVRG